MAINPGFAAFIAKKKKGGGAKEDPKAKGGNPFAKGGDKSGASKMRSDKLKQIAGGK